MAFTSLDMEAAMENAADIDEMAQCHIKYVAKLQERALLSDDLKPIHKAVIEMFDLSVLLQGPSQISTAASLVIREHLQ